MNTIKNICKEDEFNLDFPDADWMTEHYATFDTPKDIIRFSLDWNTYITISLFFLNIKIHIREYSASTNLPTKKGVVMSPHTWFIFSHKIFNFSPSLKNNNFMCNEELTIFGYNEIFTIIQQIHIRGEHFSTSPNYIKLCPSQLEKLRDLINSINKHIIVTFFHHLLPLKVIKIRINKPNRCDMTSHFASSEDVENCVFLTITHHFIKNLNILYQCESCVKNIEHECQTISMMQKFHQVGEEALFSLNINDIATELGCQKCLCFFSEEMFKNIAIEKYLDYIQSNI